MTNNTPTRAEAAERAHARGMDEGADFAINYLAKLLDAENWTVCDGTEEWEGDVEGTIFNVLIAGRVINEEDHAIARHPTVTPDLKAGEGMGNEEVCMAVREAAKRVTGGNCAFADDDAAILAELAERAVTANLIDGLDASVTDSPNRKLGRAALRHFGELGQPRGTAQPPQCQEPLPKDPANG